ncbi:Uncharacterised protein [Corynebacterium matruchotii]|jgi:hypothetical protein|uniref:hypothetical protein n=1 Tax=Corynebacterium matruchotii TaxID=43768 RepID=UPI000F6F7AC6|nr:hypothetical protein [Corynebacterium matruchotii]VEI97567.1 Uncharacterised protein [Corynebacterium matruchotii]
MEEYDISADAPLNEVLTALWDSKLFISEAKSGDVTHFRADSGSFVLVLEEEGVTWLNVCEKEDDGLQFIVFDELKKHLRAWILRDSRDVTDPGEQYMPETNLDDEQRSSNLVDYPKKEARLTIGNGKPGYIPSTE